MWASALLILAGVAVFAGLLAGQRHFSSRLEGPFPVGHAPAQPNKDLVIFGDSRAALWPLETFPNDISVSKSAIYGEVTESMVARFEADVLTKSPSSIAIVAGINDVVAASVLNDDRRELAMRNLTENLKHMALAAAKQDIDVYLFTVGSPIDPDWKRSLIWGLNIPAQLTSVNQEIRKVNSERLVVLDTDASLELNTEKGRLRARKDALHYTEQAYAELTRVLLEAVGGRR